MATFTVTTAADVVNAGDGVLSLREAIAQANATTAADTILFASNIAGATIALTQGELAVSRDLTIDGNAKGGPGITQSDLLVINKTDLAKIVGADLDVMERDTKRMRGSGPFVFAQVKNGVGVEDIIHHILHAWQHAIGVAHSH